MVSMMWRYLQILRGYDLRDHLAEPRPDVAAWLTGQSAYRHSQLSPQQLAVLEGLTELGYHPIRGGFPYNRGSLAEPYVPEPLVAAAWRNGVQHASSIFSRATSAELARHLQPMIDSASRSLLLLCGSCGLQLFASARLHLSLPRGLRLAVVALGPVCWSVIDYPQIELTVVRGSRDWISRLGSRLSADASPPVGHMDYAAHPAVRQAIHDAAYALSRT